MKYWWLSFLLITLLACQPAAVQEETVCNAPYFEYKDGDCCLDENTNAICDDDETVKEEPVVEQTKPEPAKPAELNHITESLNKFNSVVQSYSFKLGDTPHYVVGDKIKIELEKPKEMTDMMINGSIRAIITDIYVDREKKTAIGYCDPRSEERMMGEFQADRSSCIKIIDIPFNLSFTKFNPKLPVDWLKQFANTKPAIVEATDQYIKQPSGWKAVNPVLHFGTEGKMTVLRIDMKTGLPLKVETKEGVVPKIISYDFFVHNKVKPERVVYKKFHK